MCVDIEFGTPMKKYSREIWKIRSWSGRCQTVTARSDFLDFGDIFKIVKLCRLDRGGGGGLVHQFIIFLPRHTRVVWGEGVGLMELLLGVSVSGSTPLGVSFRTPRRKEVIKLANFRGWISKTSRSSASFSLNYACPLRRTCNKEKKWYIYLFIKENVTFWSK